MFPINRALLRGLGAFYIKRKIDPVAGKKDIVYRAILHTYMQHALKAGHNVEFFIEGGRTRTGKPCMPKGGVLSGRIHISPFNSMNFIHYLSFVTNLKTINKMPCFSILINNQSDHRCVKRWNDKRRFIGASFREL